MLRVSLLFLLITLLFLTFFITSIMQCLVFYFQPCYFLSSIILSIKIGQQQHRRQRYVYIAIFLTLALLLSQSVLASISLFLLTCLYLSSLLLFNNMLLCLLTLLVYLGALMVLFAYIWIFITSSLPFPLYLPLAFSLFVILLSGSSSVPSAIRPYLYTSSFLLYLVCLLFWAIVVVVHILDLSLGGFST